MERDIILDLALLPRRVKTCPKCEKRLANKPAILRVGIPKQPNYVEVILLFCSTCNEYYGSEFLVSGVKIRVATMLKKEKKKVRVPHHFYHETNTASKLANEYPQEQAQSSKEPIKKLKSHHAADVVPASTEQYIELGGETVRTIPWSLMRSKKTKRNVLVTLHEFTKCPNCRRALFGGHIAFIPISENKCVECELSVCRVCDLYYSEKTSFVMDLAQKCIDKGNFFIDSTYLHDIQNYQNNVALHKLRSAYCRFIICTSSRVLTYTIVTNLSEESLEDNVLHYCRPLALELLTAHVLKSDTIDLEGIEYIIQRCDYLNHEDARMKILRPDDRIYVEKRSNGGYYDPDEHVIFVDGLVFCEKSNHLELLRMSYDTSTKEYFVDTRLYHAFIRQHGYPIVGYCSNSGGFGELKVESLLHQLGYNVNQKDALTSAERQQMLARFVDLGFVSVSSVVNLLVSLIHRNGTRSPISKAKWEEDLKFISNYKINHERFAFVERITQATRKK